MKYWTTLLISQQGHKEDDLSMVFAIIYNPSFISWTGRVLNLGLGSRLRGGGGVVGRFAIQEDCWDIKYNNLWFHSKVPYKKSY